MENETSVHVKYPWTVEQVENHLRVNTCDTYSMATVAAALFHKLYGYTPKIGLSGFQGGGVEILITLFPEPIFTGNPGKIESKEDIDA